MSIAGWSDAANPGTAAPRGDLLLDRLALLWIDDVLTLRIERGQLRLAFVLLGPHLRLDRRELRLRILALLQPVENGRQIDDGHAGLQRFRTRRAVRPGLVRQHPEQASEQKEGRQVNDRRSVLMDGVREETEDRAHRSVGAPRYQDSRLNAAPCRTRPMTSAVPISGSPAASEGDIRRETEELRPIAVFFLDRKREVERERHRTELRDVQPHACPDRDAVVIEADRIGHCAGIDEEHPGDGVLDQRELVLGTREEEPLAATGSSLRSPLSARMPLG